MESSDWPEIDCCDIGILAGGCSGPLTEAQLFRNAFRGRIAIVEMRQSLGRGLVYSTPFEEHLLNVTAGQWARFQISRGIFSNGSPGSVGLALLLMRLLLANCTANILGTCLGMRLLECKG
jgi:hypothetical protein